MLIEAVLFVPHNVPFRDDVFHIVEMRSIGGNVFGEAGNDVPRVLTIDVIGQDEARDQSGVLESTCESPVAIGVSFALK